MWVKIQNSADDNNTTYKIQTALSSFLHVKLSCSHLNWTIYFCKTIMREVNVYNHHFNDIIKLKVFENTRMRSQWHAIANSHALCLSCYRLMAGQMDGLALAHSYHVGECAGGGGIGGCHVASLVKFRTVV